MAITITLANTPDTLEPVNTPLWFRVTSTASSLTDFKYIFKPMVKLEPFTSSSYSELSLYKIPPRPDGAGIFSPNRILKAYLNDTINPFISAWTYSESSLEQYQTRYGYEYNPGVTFSDTISISGYLGLTFSTTHDFLEGDIIRIDKTNKSYNPEYDGTCSVTSIYNTLSIKTDKIFNTSTLLTGEDGTITNIHRMIGTSSAFYAWNGTRQYDEANTDFTNVYIMSGSTSSFLTSYNQNRKPIQLDDYETLSVILNYATFSALHLLIDTYTTGGGLIDNYDYALPQTGYFYKRQNIGIGPMNLTGVTWSGVGYYTVKLQIGGDVMSQIFTYSIDTSCSNYNKVRMCFLNRKGGYDYFNFTLDNKKVVNITKTEYEKVLPWNYSIGDRGKTILGQKVEETYTVNSNWITEKDSIWLEELLTSPDVYILSGTNKYPIVITDTSYEAKTYLRNQLFNLVVNYKMSNKINIQNE